jgi:hopanoid biosynthesis associated protein HpnK
MSSAAALPLSFPLIINGDDFGYSSAANRAILQAHQEGVLTSTSLMVNERAADEAVQLAKTTPSLAVGLHLVLVLGRATLSPKQIPHLVNDDGKFTNSPFVAGVKYFFSSAARRELNYEMRAQFEKFVATGLPFSHVDGHTHLHMHPVIFDELLKLCEEFNVKRLRVVKGELRVSLRLDRSHLPLQLVNGIVFNLLARRCEKRLRGRGFVVPENVYGLLQTGNLNEDYWLGLIPQMARTSCEIYAHPLAPDAEDWNARENPRGAIELQALLSPRVRETIQQAGFRLATYQHLS